MKKSKIQTFLNFIERVGNKLPHPGMLFFYFSIAVILFSGIGAALGWEVVYTGLVKVDGVLIPQEVTAGVNSLLSLDGVRHIFSSMVSNFTGFAPLGSVMVALIGISVAEHAGLIEVLLKGAAVRTPKRLITMMVVFLGIMSNVASDAGYVFLPPLAAMMFLSMKRHPLAGLAAAFAGVSGGYSANLILSSLDPLLADFTTEAARILDPTYVVSSSSNWIFMAASVFVIMVVGSIVTEKIVEPNLGKYTGSQTAELSQVTKEENLALKKTLVAFVALIVALIALYMVLGFDLFFGNAMVPVIVMVFLVPGVTYGYAIGKIQSSSQIMDMIAKSFSSMGSYLVLVFFAGQFINYFTYSNLGTIIAVNGANLLQTAQLPSFLLVLLFILIVAFINLFMGSASAKWAILAPVFVPIMMNLGISPEFTQLAYRIGDSSTNIISPLMSYFPMIIIYMKSYNKDASIGTLVSMMLPYSLAFLLSWSVLLIIWMQFNLPIGIDAHIFLP